MTGREDDTVRFLAQNGWGHATRAPLAGDASARRYERLHLDARSAILMDAPPDRGEDVSRFTRMARWLQEQGYSPPLILAEDPDRGFLLLEDLGDDLVARLVKARPAQEPELYAAATVFLADLATRPVPGFVRLLDAEALAALLGWVGEWYLPALDADPAIARDLPGAFADLYRTLAGATPPVLSLRDFHAENLIWLPGRKGHARLGLLDFQDAVAAHPAYDLASLLQDARRDVDPATEAAMIDRYCAESGRNSDDFLPVYALLGAHRSLRILAVFARLCLHLGRPGYLAYMPRVWGYLVRDRAHPALAPLAGILDRLPAPTEAALTRLKGTCP